MAVKKEKLTKEDIALAKSKIKEFTQGNGKILKQYGGSAILGALAMVADKLCRDDEGKFKPGFFYTYLTSNILSGASADILQNLIDKRIVTMENNIAKNMHHEFNSFSIAEREARKRNTEETMNDVNALKISASGYLGAKCGLLNGSITSATLIGATLLSGGLANLPIMAGVIAASGLNSYLLNRKMNEEKIALKNQIRQQNSLFRAVDRQLYVASYKLETSDKENVGEKKFDEQRNAYEQKYHELLNMFIKYAKIGTAVKAMVIGGVVAATIASPTNALVATGAAFGIYAAVNRFVNSCYSLKEHIGNFAHAYKNFKPKLKVNFGNEKIKENYNTIELDNIIVKKRDDLNPLQAKNEILFSGEGQKLHIGPGITFLSGASGAGKSSLINLLMHSNNIDGGSIKIGRMYGKEKFIGTDYNDLAFAEPAKKIALSMQKPEFIEVTVDQYIRLSNPDAPEEFVQQIKDLVGIKKGNDNEFIDPDKVITVTGNNISGGQANRLNLAQALIKDSTIMILDEPTAGVDPTMAENIVNYLNEIKDSKTIIYVTHNLPDTEKLQAYQAIDLGKEPGDKYAKIRLYDDLLDADKKREYLEVFKNRNSGRSPSSPVLPELNEEDIHAKIDDLRTTIKEKENNTEGNTKNSNLVNDNTKASGLVNNSNRNAYLEKFFSGYEPHC